MITPAQLDTARNLVSRLNHLREKAHVIKHADKFQVACDVVGLQELKPDFKSCTLRAGGHATVYVGGEDAKVIENMLLRSVDNEVDTITTELRQIGVDPEA